MDCIKDPYACDFVQPGEYWAGSIAIDLGAAPDLRGKTLSLFSEYRTGESYIIGSISEAGPNTDYDWVPWLKLTGVFAGWASGSIHTSDLSFSFDQSGNVTCWSGYSYWGGDGDPGSTCGYDYFAYIDVFASGPGLWTNNAVSPVPLPASIFLLF